MSYCVCMWGGPGPCPCPHNPAWRVPSDFLPGRVELPQQGCICPPTSEQTCQNPICPRKARTGDVRGMRPVCARCKSPDHHVSDCSD